MSSKPQQEFGFDTPQEASPSKGKGKKAKPPAASKTTTKTDEKAHDKTRTTSLVRGHGPLQKLVDFNFLQYASYVICERAIPEVSDGLKPVQRRILHSLHETDDGRFMKVANIVGHCMKYHPHGDASIGDALVTLVNRGYLIEGQGNFGNPFTGDRAAAPRYIECRLTPMAREELFNNPLTEFTPSYDGRNKEPIVLPSKLPLLLMLGAEGIAVGLSTKIFPHNFTELIEAQIAILQKKPFTILPDFPQGGLIDVGEYDRGFGRIRLRARMENKGTGALVITQLPCGQTTESLISSIEDAVRKKKVPVRTINDYTSEKVEIELILTQGADQDNAKDALFAFTNCEGAVTGRVVVIHEKRPVEMKVDDVLRLNTKQLLDILKRELELRKHNLLESLHNKTLVQIFIENRIYKRIEKCKTAEAVRKAVLDGLAPFRKELRRDVTPEDVEMLLGVRIRRISLFDINKNKQEMADILKEIEAIDKSLARPKAYATRYLKGLLKKYGDAHPRKTVITKFDAVEVRQLTARELELKYDSETGYIGSAISGETLLHCSSLDKIVVAWKDGRYKVQPPPDKMFVGDSMLYCKKAERDRVMTAIYTAEDFDFTYIKRFSFGGWVLNRDYRYAPEHSVVHLFSDEPVDQVYVKYKKAKNQRIHQQVFYPKTVAVKGVKARGNQMTAKKIARIAIDKPRWWSDDGKPPPGILV